MIAIGVLIVVIGLIAPKPTNYRPHIPGWRWYAGLTCWFWVLSIQSPVM